MDLLQIWATWIVDRYERVKESLTFTFHVLFTKPCYGNYFLFSGKQIFASIKGANIILFRGVRLFLERREVMTCDAADKI